MKRLDTFSHHSRLLQLSKAQAGHGVPQSACCFTRTVTFGVVLLALITRAPTQPWEV